jgi:lipoprotein signal peptidase
MTSKLGGLSVIAGIVLGLFALLGKFMGTAGFISTMTLSTFFEGVTGALLDKISNDTVYNALYSFFYEIHLAGVLIGLGVILLIIGTFIRKD